MLYPPDHTDPQLKHFLEKLVSKVDELEAKLGKVSMLTSLPAKPIPGKLYYFENTVGATITSIGFWRYNSGVWTYVG